jgi:two-component system chemotaxis sensor kinase CheA
MDMSQYRDLFVSEARRHLETFNTLLVQLESSPDGEVIHEIFRHAHSLKGMAATMRFDAIATLAHRVEDLMAKVRDGKFSPDPGLTDILLEGSDLLGSMVTAIEADDGGPFPDAQELISRIVAFPPSPGEAGQPAPDGTEQPPLPSPPHQFRQSDSFTTVRVKTETLDRLVTLTGELITTQHHLADQGGSASPSGMAEPLRQLARLVRELRDEVFQARMLPFSMIAERFPRLVRDLAREQGKEVRLVIKGGEIELDRGILEAVTEPLVHLLRNAVDHGLELPGERVEAGKERCGQITLAVTRKKDQVGIVVADNGRGMDPARLKQRALEQGKITPDQAAAMSTEEALTLICAPGFSTAETVTDISGRGVGMDAVRSAVRTLGGALSIQASVGQGSLFRLTLPLTVSIIQALLVECGPLTVALPVNAVERTLELTRDEIMEQDGRRFFPYAGDSVPLVNLHQLLGRLPPPATPRHCPVIVTTANGAPLGLVVDAITGQREIFVKPLGRPFSRLGTCSGGAILGNGRIVFVMDVNTFA